MVSKQNEAQFPRDCEGTMCCHGSNATETSPVSSTYGLQMEDEEASEIARIRLHLLDGSAMTGFTLSGRSQVKY